MATKAATGKKRMTQSEVINHFAESTGMKRAQVKEFFEELSALAAREVQIEWRVCSSRIWKTREKRPKGP